MKLFTTALVFVLGSSAAAYAQKPAESAKSTTPTSSAAATKSTDKEAATPEQEKHIKAMLGQTKKSFAAAELTAEQEKQADEQFAKAVKSFVLKRDAAKITPEMQKQHAARMKEARSSGKSTKDQATAAFEKAGMDEEQIKVFKSTQAALAKAKRNFAKILDAKQVDKLPQATQKMLAGGK